MNFKETMTAGRKDAFRPRGPWEKQKFYARGTHVYVMCLYAYLNLSLFSWMLHIREKHQAAEIIAVYFNFSDVP